MTDTTDDIAEDISFQAFEDDCQLLGNLLNDCLQHEVGNDFMEKVERARLLAQVFTAITHSSFVSSHLSLSRSRWNIKHRHAFPHLIGFIFCITVEQWLLVNWSCFVCSSTAAWSCSHNNFLLLLLLLLSVFFLPLVYFIRYIGSANSSFLMFQMAYSSSKFIISSTANCFGNFLAVCSSLLYVDGSLILVIHPVVYVDGLIILVISSSCICQWLVIPGDSSFLYFKWTNSGDSITPLYIRWLQESKVLALLSFCWICNCQMDYSRNSSLYSDDVFGISSYHNHYFLIRPWSYDSCVSTANSYFWHIINLFILYMWNTSSTKHWISSVYMPTGLVTNLFTMLNGVLNLIDSIVFICQWLHRLL